MRSKHRFTWAALCACLAFASPGAIASEGDAAEGPGLPAQQAALPADAQSSGGLDDAGQAAVAVPQQVDKAVTPQESERVVCKSVRAIGSNRKTRQCTTVPRSDPRD